MDRSQVGPAPPCLTTASDVLAARNAIAADRFMEFYHQQMQKWTQ